MKIPVAFEFDGKEYFCYLTPVSGSGNNSLFHLMHGGWYLGQLFYTAYGWQFGGNIKGLSELSGYFGDVIITCINGASLNSPL